MARADTGELNVEKSDRGVLNTTRAGALSPTIDSLTGEELG
jgi:hypothetical protein